MHLGDLHANPKLATDERLEQPVSPAQQAQVELTQLPICDVRDREATLGHCSLRVSADGVAGALVGVLGLPPNKEPGVWETGRGGIRPLSEFPSEAATQYEDETTRGHLTAWS